MERIINVEVNGNHISKDHKNAGVKGEANVAILRITFDVGWDVYTKKVTFWDARGFNPVVIDLLPHLAENETTYLVPIPGEPMTEAGELTFVIDGTVDDKVQRSVSDKLEVKDAPITQNAGQPVPPTENELTQLMGEIEKIKDDVLATRDAKEATQIYRDEAKLSADEAEQSASEAKQSADKAVESVGRTSYIGDNGNWFAWDSEQSAFYDTGVKAQAGSEVYVGENPPKSAAVWIDPNGGEVIEAFFIVNLTHTIDDDDNDLGITADKTFKEMFDALDNNKTVIARLKMANDPYSVDTYVLTTASLFAYYFTQVRTVHNEPKIQCLICSISNDWVLKKYGLELCDNRVAHISTENPNAKNYPSEKAVVDFIVALAETSFSDYYTVMQVDELLTHKASKAETYTKEETRNYVDVETKIIKADLEGIQRQVETEAHFRGYVSTNAKIQALVATPNDFAYSAESGTKWIYDAVDGWKNTGITVPDQLTPASETTPLINGAASVGSEEAYARGDHRHPTDTTRLSVAEFNEFKSELETGLDNIIAIQNRLIGGGSV